MSGVEEGPYGGVVAPSIYLYGIKVKYLLLTCMCALNTFCTYVRVCMYVHSISLYVPYVDDVVIGKCNMQDRNGETEVGGRRHADQ